MRRLLRRPGHATVVAYLALFVALGGTAMAAFVVSSNSQIGPNTIYGAVKPSTANDNIVDGSIGGADIALSTIGGNRVKDGTLTNADLAAGTLTGSRIKDGTVAGADMVPDTVTGTQIAESTLGRVPDTNAVDGVPPDGFRHFGWTARQSTSSCAQSQIWRECAVYALTVPPGHHYVVTIMSTINANPGNITGAQVLACPATDGPTCTTRTSPERSDFPANLFSSWTTSTTEDFFAGSYRLNTAMKWNVNVPASTEAVTSTTVDIYDYRMESIG